MQPTVLEEMKSIKKEERKKSYVIALLYYYKILLSHVGRTQQFNHYHKPSVIQTANNNIGITAANVDIYDSVVVFLFYFGEHWNITGCQTSDQTQEKPKKFIEEVYIQYIYCIYKCTNYIS